MVSHDLSSIKRTATRVAFLAEKKVICVDKLDVVMRNQHPLIKSFFDEK